MDYRVTLHYMGMKVSAINDLLKLYPHEKGVLINGSNPTMKRLSFILILVFY